MRGGRAELTEQYTKLSGKIMEHYERCHICYVDGGERRNATCKDMKDYLSNLAKIR
jgi:hypothetical protein